MIEEAFYQEVITTHLKDKEITRLNSKEDPRDPFSKETIDKIEIFIETKTIETMTTMIENTIEDLTQGDLHREEAIMREWIRIINLPLIIVIEVLRLGKA